jgi:hypothetical protein
MKTLLMTLLFAVGLFCLIPAATAQAQSCGGIEQRECAGVGTSDIDHPGTLRGDVVNTGVTRDIVRILEGANKTCDSRVDLVYRIDCLRIYYLRVADRLPDSGDYLPVKQAMLDAAAKLDAIVVQYQDDMAPSIRPREGHKPLAKRLPPVRPVKEAFAETAAAEAARVVEETELIIIRSGGDPARRTQHYTDVAAAVEENLVILRSA